MPSKVQKKIQKARDKQCYTFKHQGEWMVVVYDDLRGPFTSKREAANFAYAASIAKIPTVEITLFDDQGNITSYTKYKSRKKGD